MLSSSIVKNGLLLCVFAVFTTGLIAVTHNATKSKIAEQRMAKQRAVLAEVVPGNLYDNTIAADCIATNHPLLGEQTKRIYRARKLGENTALAVEFTTQNGYSGKIDLLLGVRKSGEVTGVRVLHHRETPGLGDKLELGISDWILSFNGQIYTNATQSDWRVKKDGGTFDQFTGATITPRAVVGAVAKALQYVSSHQQMLFEQPSNCLEKPPINE